MTRTWPRLNLAAAALSVWAVTTISCSKPAKVTFWVPRGQGKNLSLMQAKHSPMYIQGSPGLLVGTVGNWNIITRDPTTKRVTKASGATTPIPLAEIELDDFDRYQGENYFPASAWSMTVNTKSGGSFNLCSSHDGDTCDALGGLPGATMLVTSQTGFDYDQHSPNALAFYPSSDTVRSVVVSENSPNLSPCPGPCTCQDPTKCLVGVW